MKTFRSTLVVFAITLSIASPSVLNAQNKKVDPQLNEKVHRDGLVRVIVSLNVNAKHEAEIDLQSLQAQRSSIRAAQSNLIAQIRGGKFRELGRLRTLPALGIEVDPIALNILASLPIVKHISESRYTKASLATAVPRIGVTGGAVGGFSGAGWMVAILDTGVDKTHPLLSGSNKVPLEACFSTNNSCVDPGTGQPVSGVTGPNAGVACNWAQVSTKCLHGTIMGAIAAGKGTNPTSANGVASEAAIISIRTASLVTGQACVAAQEPDPCVLFDHFDNLQGLDYVLYLRSVGHNVAAVNWSQGSGDYPDQELCDASTPSDMMTAIINLRTYGIATVASSGNRGRTNTMDWPGCISSVVSVGGTTNPSNPQTADAIWGSSDSAPFLSLLAPAESIIMPNLSGSGTWISSGTSNSAAFVSGAWTILKQKNPTATVGQILNALQTTGVKITDTRAGANSRVNCRIQIDQALNNIPEPLVTLNFAQAAAYGINNCGQIVGTSYDNWAGTGFITDTRNNSTPLVYDGPVTGEYFGTYAWSINNKGEVHGYYCCDDWDVGFTRSAAGSFSKFAANPNTNTIYGNNDFGDFVGFFWDSEWYHYNGRYVNGTTTLSEDILFFDINNMRRLVGMGDSGAFIVNESGNTTSFNYAPGGYTDAYGINESGHVVGCYWPDSGPGNGYLRDPNGTLTAINYGASETCALGINDSRQIVGYYVDGGGTWKAFVDLSW